MGERPGRANWIGSAVPAALFRLALFLVLTGFCFGADIGANAAENGGTDPAAEAVMIRVEGQLEEIDREALLERINAIRLEACEEGVNNPVNGEPLTASDYVPLEWSRALEEIAVIRAAESTILQDHMRPDGTECFTAAPEGVYYTMETLAWGFGSAALALEGWYSEKTSYVEADGGPAGHYMALINPENRYVGIADLRAQWQRDACAGAFGETAGPDLNGNAGDSDADEKESGADGKGETAHGQDGESVWMIPLRADFLPKVIGRAVEIVSGRIWRAAAF